MCIYIYIYIYYKYNQQYYNIIDYNRVYYNVPPPGWPRRAAWGGAAMGRRGRRPLREA